MSYSSPLLACTVCTTSSGGTPKRSIPLRMVAQSRLTRQRTAIFPTGTPCAARIRTSAATRRIWSHPFPLSSRIARGGSPRSPSREAGGRSVLRNRSSLSAKIRLASSSTCGCER